MTESKHSEVDSSKMCAKHNQPKICRINLADGDINLCSVCAMDYFTSEKFARLVE